MDVRKVSRACDRCRKQKLKCDVMRPCTLCSRSATTCTTTTQTPRRRHSTRFDANKVQGYRHGRGHNGTSNGNDPECHGVTALSLGDSAVSASDEPTRLPAQRSSQPTGGNERASSMNDFERSPRVDTTRSPTGTQTSPTRRQSSLATDSGFSGDSSTIGLTRGVFNFNNSQHHYITSALPGGANEASPEEVVFQDMTHSNALLPPAAVVEALINTYFETVHWFIYVLHEGSFREQASRVLTLSPSDLTPADEDFVTLLMMVVAMGAQYAVKNPSWKSRWLLEKYSINLLSLNRKFVHLVQTRLFHSLERCQIEVVQTCLLLGTFYLYHGNPSLCWSILGLAVKSAYALAIHREADVWMEGPQLQARKRTWAHTVVADTFAAVIYGRPSTVDQAFCDASYPDEFEDTELPLPLRGFAESLNEGRAVSRLTFHINKYRLYELKAEIFRKLFSLHTRLSFSAQARGVKKLIETIRDLDDRLKAWWRSLTPFYRCSEWKLGLEDPFPRGTDEMLNPEQLEIKRQLIRQAITLQVSYDNTLILLHRPLLEYKMTSHRKGKPSAVSSDDPFASSFNSCISAALRISQVPAHQLQFDLPLAFITVHMFTAGVILCIPPTIDPFSYLAHETKGGVVRIIRMHKRLSTHTPIAAQSHLILEELMKVVLRRELEIVLKPGGDDYASNYGEKVIEGHTNDVASAHVINTDSQRSTEELPSDTAMRIVTPDSPPPTTTTFQITEPENAAHQARESWEISSEIRSVGPYMPLSANEADHPFYHDPTANSASDDLTNATSSYSDFGIETDDSFINAYGEIERVVYDFAPSGWLGPVWMQPYENNDVPAPL